jgi:hypothetical protein
LNVRCKILNVKVRAVVTAVTAALTFCTVAPAPVKKNAILLHALGGY